MSKARPEEKISEVVDDMLDAVAGTTPLVYQIVPNNERSFVIILSILFLFIVEVRSGYGRSISLSSSRFNASGSSRPFP